MASNQLFVLYESASGYALFERLQAEEIGNQTDAVQQSVQDFGRFARIIKLKSFLPFTDQETALSNQNDLSEGVLNDFLKNFLQTNFPKVKPGKSSNYLMGVSEDRLGSAIQETLGLKCEKNQLILELVRGIRFHFEKYIEAFREGDIEKAQRGLAHTYSRAKVKFNVHRVDNMIIQSISLLDQMDKDLNTFAMRCKEWYSWHFPELSRIVPDHKQFAKVVKIAGNKENLTEEHLPALEEVVGSAEKAQEILDAARASMGTDISEIDLENIDKFADRVVALAQYRENLHNYLLSKMAAVAPNLSTLIGEQVAARLISHAGSLTNLAKYPASTVQILGAEKALFRALKTRGNTPKYGLIFHSSFIGKASSKNKGRISRYLANKCSIAARIDCFGEYTTSKFGEKLRDQVDERLNFYDTGNTPKKNVDVMHDVLEEVKRDGLFVETKKPEDGEKKKKKKKRSKEEESEEVIIEEAAPMETEEPAEKKSKKEKKAKKEKKQKRKE